MADAAPFSIREATVADVRAIAEVHVEGWAWGYQGLLPDDVIAARDVDVREQEWIRGFTEDWREGDVNCANQPLLRYAAAAPDAAI